MSMDFLKHDIENLAYDDDPKIAALASMILRILEDKN